MLAPQLLLPETSGAPTGAPEADSVGTPLHAAFDWLAQVAVLEGGAVSVVGVLLLAGTLTWALVVAVRGQFGQPQVVQAEETPRGSMGEGGLAEGDQAVKAGREAELLPLCPRSEVLELTEVHGLEFAGPGCWRGRLQTLLPLDTGYSVRWNASRSRWQVEVDEPGRLAEWNSACWHGGRLNWHPEEGLPGVERSALATHAAFLALVEQVHRRWGVPLEGGFFRKRSASKSRRSA